MFGASMNLLLVHHEKGGAPDGQRAILVGNNMPTRRDLWCCTPRPGPVFTVVPYLDERVQRLPIEPLEVGPDVQHVNLCPRNHHSDEGAVISA